jgi:hypothetical protein
VRIAGLVVPLWSPLIATGLIACSLSFVAGTWKGRRERPAPSPAAPAPPPSIEPAATDGSALARIAGQPPDQRSSDDTLALSRGELAQKIAELRELGDRVAADPDVLRDKRTRALLRTRAYEQDTHRDAQAVIAAVPGADSADMLYSVWTGTAARTDATRLAEQLVYSTDVRAKASPSLAVVLDLWRSDKCEAVAALLPRVAAHGDHRSLGRLNLLRPTVGCGDDKKQDCYPCLREGDALDEAIAAASRRAPPTP